MRFFPLHFAFKCILIEEILKNPSIDFKQSTDRVAGGAFIDECHYRRGLLCEGMGKRTKKALFTGSFGGEVHNSDYALQKSYHIVVTVARSQSTAASVFTARIARCRAAWRREERVEHCIAPSDRGAAL